MSDADVLRAEVLRLHKESVRQALIRWTPEADPDAGEAAEADFRTALDALVLTAQDAGLEMAAKVADEYAERWKKWAVHWQDENDDGRTVERCEARTDAALDIAQQARALKARPEAEEKP